jgi:methylenetetrahydrofolate dehydrogenase (NADP+)/methenyltetrahydrofolate cyclohydrolase
METKIIDGKKLAESIKAGLRDEIAGLPFGVSLSVILAGNDGGSQVYVKNKIKDCEEVGIKSYAFYLPEDVSERELLDLVEAQNQNKKVNGVLVQLPLPKGLDEQKVLELIAPEKDVDGFHRLNAGGLFTGGGGLRPCTPSGIIELIKSTGAKIEGSNTVVVGRSNIVGKPVGIMMLSENATVTFAHSRTKNLSEVTRRADILIVAIGKAKFITKEYLKPGAVVIDVGTSRLDKLYGDVDFEDALGTAGYITPVPGGVGPMTRAMLLANTVKAAKEQNKK